MSQPPSGDLSGPWRVAPLDDALRRTGADADLDDSDWLELTVPGHWASEPRLADHDGPLLHRLRFEHPPPEPGRRVWLRLDGVMSTAEVWMDGRYLGDTIGYFAPHRFDVTDLMRTDLARADLAPADGDTLDDTHVLAVEVSCPPDRGGRSKTGLTGSIQTGSLAPPGRPGGIWRPVVIDETGPVAIRHSRLLCRSADEDRAELLVRLVLDADRATDIRIDTSVAGPDGSAAGGGVQHHSLATGENRLEWTIEIDDPALWWPAALGDQPLYDMAVAIRTDDGELSDRREWRTGLRSIEIDDFVWRVNGRRLFTKGIAYGPTDAHLDQVDPDRIRDDVAAVVEAGLDLMRVHGHVARPELYAEADRRGVLIWQDLPLVGGYSSKIRSAVRTMARAAVDQLGHHPSVAVWCGHCDPNGPALPQPGGRTAAGVALDAVGELERFGSDQDGHTDRTDDHAGEIDGDNAGDRDSDNHGDGRRRRVKRPSFLRQVSRHVLPSWNRSVLDPLVGRELRNADRSRPVITKSGSLPSLADPTGSDAHLWLGWHIGQMEDLPELLRQWPRLAAFPGGIGTQSAAVEPWPITAPEWSTAEVGAFERYLPRRAYPDGRSWAEATRAYQADVLRLHIETLRRLKYRPTGGFCLWTLADAEPAGGFGILDFDRRPKPAHDAVVDACRPVVVVADQLPPVVVPGQEIRLDVHVVNDLHRSLGDVRVRARAATNDWSKRVVWEGVLDADACLLIGEFRFEVPSGHGSLTVDLEVVSDDLAVTNRYSTVIIPRSEALPSTGPPRIRPR